MKPFPHFVLTTGIVLAALLIYDQGQDDCSTCLRTFPSEYVTSTEIADLEQRVSTIESKQRPTLRANGVDPRVRKRLEELSDSFEKLKAMNARTCDQIHDAAPVTSLPGESTFLSKRSSHAQNEIPVLSSLPIIDAYFKYASQGNKEHR